MSNPAASPYDWTRFDAMSDEEVIALAESDPDALPFSDQHLARLPRTPAAFVIRRALRLSQEEFAARFHIPLAKLQDWERGVSQPDETARAYLKVIGSDPDGVQSALARTR